MSGHTPGPWSLKEHSSKEYGKPDLCSHAVMGANELQIATVVSDCIDDFEANARLIAAAPQLLAAAQLALLNLRRNLASEEACGKPFMGDDEHEAIRVLTAAIQKVTQP